MHIAKPAFGLVYWSRANIERKASVKGIAQAINAEITAHLGLNFVWYLLGFTIL